jgi:hypothetical protein
MIAVGSFHGLNNILALFKILEHAWTDLHEHRSHLRLLQKMHHLRAREILRETTYWYLCWVSERNCRVEGSPVQKVRNRRKKVAIQPSLVRVTPKTLAQNVPPTKQCNK